jgi:hypothetical protein
VTSAKRGARRARVAYRRGVDTIAVKLAVVLLLFLAAGVLLGWGSGGLAKGMKRRPRYRYEVRRWGMPGGRRAEDALPESGADGVTGRPSTPNPRIAPRPTIELTPVRESRPRRLERGKGHGQGHGGHGRDKGDGKGDKGRGGR